MELPINIDSEILKTSGDLIMFANTYRALANKQVELLKTVEELKKEISELKAELGN